MSSLQTNIHKLVKGANGVVKALQAAHSNYWDIWGRAPPGKSVYYGIAS